MHQSDNSENSSVLSSIYREMSDCPQAKPCPVERASEWGWKLESSAQQNIAARAFIVDYATPRKQLRSFLMIAITAATMTLALACDGGGGGGGGGAPAAAETTTPNGSTPTVSNQSGSGSGGDTTVVPTPTTITYSFTVSWTANREKAVNQSGGGYKVYYSTSPGFGHYSASYTDAPYAYGSQAPTSAKITVASPGTYYVKVVAYSAIKPAGSNYGATSEPSFEYSITVP